MYGLLVYFHFNVFVSFECFFISLVFSLDLNDKREQRKSKKKQEKARKRKKKQEKTRNEILLFVSHIFHFVLHQHPV